MQQKSTCAGVYQQSYAQTAVSYLTANLEAAEVGSGRRSGRAEGGAQFAPLRSDQGENEEKNRDAGDRS
jgi:hypothetical protein